MRLYVSDATVRFAFCMPYLMPYGLLPAKKVGGWAALNLNFEVRSLMQRRATVNEFAQHMADVFRLFGPVSLRRMFSGHGIFRDGIMFGLVYGETLYLKVDTENIADFRALGLPQFEYIRQGKAIGLSYYQAPECVLEDISEAAIWASRAFEAARRADLLKQKPARNRRGYHAET